MRKFLKRFPFNKVFTALFVLFYTFLPSVQGIGIVIAESSVDKPIEVGNSQGILADGISDPEEIANPEVLEEEIPEPTYEDGVYTVNSVELKEYVYPDNEGVRVKFTNITEEGNLVISKVELTEEEKEELNTYDDYGWDISSSMSNGSFTYDLTLPNTSGNDDVEVKYTEDGEVYTSIEEVVVNEEVIYIEGLEHFTTFVVASLVPVRPNEQPKCQIWIEGVEHCFETIQEAISKAEEKQIIYVAPGDYKGPIDIAVDYLTIQSVQGPKETIIIGEGGEVPTIMFSSNNSSLRGFTIDNNGGQRAIAPKDSYGAIIEKNIIRNSYRGIQGDWYGRSEYFQIRGNTFEKVDYGIAGTEGIGKMPLILVDNIFYTNVEGIGLGEGVVLEKDWTIDTILSNNKFPLVDGYAIGDYRNGSLSPTKYTPEGYLLVQKGDSIQKVLDIAPTGATVQVGADTFKGGVVINKPVNLTHGSLPVIDCGGTGTGITINSSNVTIDGFEVRNCGFGIKSYGGPNTYEMIAIKNNYIHSNSVNGILFVHDTLNDVTIKNTTIEKTYGSGGVGFGIANNATINNLTLDTVKIEHSAGHGIYINNSVLKEVSINNLFINDIAWEGIHITNSTKIGDFEIENSAISNAGVGIYITDEGTNTLENFDISSSIIEENDKAGWNYNGIWNKSSDSINAERNWWGSGDGPSGEGSGAGDGVSPNVKYCPWLDAEDGDPVGPCLGDLQGRTFIDKNWNGLLLSSDEDYPSGMKDGFTVRLYDEDWNSLGQQTTNTTGEVGQFHFSNLVNTNNTYYVCGTYREGYFYSPAQIGQTVLNTNGHTPSGYEYAEIVTNGSGESDESPVCWEITLDSETDGAYLGVGYTTEKPDDPVQTEYKDTDGKSYSCTNGYTNMPSIAVYWSDVSTGSTPPDDILLYQRQYSLNGVNWSGNEIYSNPYTNQRSFGGGEGMDGVFYSRVRAFYDINDNNKYDLGEPVSENWSNECSITHDTVKPKINLTLPNNEGVYGGIIDLQAICNENCDYINFWWREEDQSYSNIAPDRRYHYEYTDGTEFNWSLNTLNAERWGGDPSYIMTDGVYYMYAAGKDLAGNWARTAETKIIVDNTAPTVEITSPENNGLYNTDVTLSATVTDANPHHYWLKITKDGTNLNIPGVTGEQSATIFSTTLTEGGEYHVTFAARDAAGGTSRSGNRSGDVNITFTIDKTYPEAPTLTGSPVQYVKWGNVTRNWLPSDSPDVDYYMYKNITNGWTSGPHYAGLSEYSITHNTGNYDRIFEWKVSAVDYAGNETWSNDTYRIVVDGTKPTVEISNVLIVDKKLSFTVSGTDNLSGAKTVATNIYDENDTNLVIEIGRLAHNITPEDLDVSYNVTDRDISTLESGIYTIRAFIRDYAGNTEYATYQINVDNTPPSIEGLLDKILLEGDSFPADTVTLTDNYELNQVCVKAEDKTGTLGASEYFCVDIDTSNLTDNQFSLANEIRKAIENWQGNPFTTIDLNVLPEGTYNISYYATDKAGNVSTTQTFVVTIQNNSPVVTITPSLTEVTAGTPVTLSASVVGGNESFTYAWSGACSGSEATTALNTDTPGTYTCTVTVTDADGDTATDNLEITVLSIPTPPPTTAEEVLGAIFTPKPVQASTQSLLGTGGYLYTQTTNEEQDTEEEETTKEETVTQEEDAEVKGEEDNGEQNSEEETTEEEGTKWWVYPLVILPVLAIFLILWKRRKEEDEPQF